METTINRGDIQHIKGETYVKGELYGSDIDFYNDIDSGKVKLVGDCFGRLDYRAIAESLFNTDDDGEYTNPLFKDILRMQEEYNASEYHRENGEYIRLQMLKKLGDITAQDFELVMIELNRMMDYEAKREQQERDYERQERNFCGGAS